MTRSRQRDELLPSRKGGRSDRHLMGPKPKGEDGGELEKTRTRRSNSRRAMLIVYTAKNRPAGERQLPVWGVKLENVLERSRLKGGEKGWNARHTERSRKLGLVPHNNEKGGIARLIKRKIRHE